MEFIAPWFDQFIQAVRLSERASEEQEFKRSHQTAEHLAQMWHLTFDKFFFYSPSSAVQLLLVTTPMCLQNQTFWQPFSHYQDDIDFLFLKKSYWDVSFKNFICADSHQYNVVFHKTRILLLVQTRQWRWIHSFCYLNCVWQYANKIMTRIKYLQWLKYAQLLLCSRTDFLCISSNLPHVDVYCA